MKGRTVYGQTSNPIPLQLNSNSYTNKPKLPGINTQNFWEDKYKLITFNRVIFPTEGHMRMVGDTTEYTVVRFFFVPIFT